MVCLGSIQGTGFSCRSLLSLTAPPLGLCPALGKGAFMHRFGRELASVFRHVTKHRGERLWAFPRGG